MYIHIRYIHRNICIYVDYTNFLTCSQLGGIEWKTTTPRVEITQLVSGAIPHPEMERAGEWILIPSPWTTLPGCFWQILALNFFGHRWL